MEKISNSISSPKLIHDIEMNMCAWFEGLSRSAAHGDFKEDPDLIQYTTAIPHPMFNGIICTQPVRNDVGDRIDNALSRFKGLPMVWWNGPFVQSQDIGEHLEQRGFSYLTDYPGMALDLIVMKREPAKPPGLDIKVVDDDDAMKVWTRILFNSFKFPDSIEKSFLELAANRKPRGSWRRYIAFLDGAPVATSELFLGAGVSGVYYVATESAVRRRGIGAAITLAPLIDALEMGYRIAILKATRIGFNIYRRIGFQEYCRLGLYIRQGDPG
ncbi:GNAT family N-acetyltransferase [Thermodesulfobacteriota bacterium]